MATSAGRQAQAQAWQPPFPNMSHLRPTCLDPTGPVPYILLSKGRSGSSSISGIIGNLTGYETRFEEYTGSDNLLSKRFFQDISKHAGADNDGWMMSHLCSKQLRYPSAGVVGFQWKPYDTIFGDSARAALQTVACLDWPKIAVVQSRRNLLDVAISSYKPTSSLGKPRTPAHCHRGDKKCLQRHTAAGTGIVLPTDNLIEMLSDKKEEEERVDKLLEELGVTYVAVKYEKLYYGGDDMSEWMRIFRFLGVGPGEGLTRKRLEGAMKIVATHPSSQNITLANYAEMVEILRGTKFEELLHS